MTQIFINPIDYGFEWTDDGWYSFDRKSSTSKALKARNATAKQLTAQGKNVRCWSMPNQLITRGGIGSGKPQIQVIVNVFCINVW